MATFNLQIVTPEREIYNQSVDSAVLPGVEGSFGVLSGHAPLIAALEPGLVRVTDDAGAEMRMFVGGGFFQVANNQAMLLADSAEMAAEINPDRAREAETRAQSRLAGQLETQELQRERAEASLKRARARMRVSAGR